MRASSLTALSPFASPDPELLSDLEVAEQNAAVPPLDVDVLEDFSDAAGVYEDDANLDPLSAMEKYCRSELAQQRLAYAAGMGAAVEQFEPHEVSGTMVSLLRELLGDVYADVRLTALQQVLPVARRLRAAGMLYQSDTETLWDLVQKLLLDADVENQEAASAVLAELSHVVAKGNAVAASQKLVLAVQKLQRLPTELHSEGALAALRLIAQVVAQREGSPLTFATIEEFSVGAFKSSISGATASPDVRQAAVLLLPRFARHMPPGLRASLLPGWVKTLAGDTHWNVRAEVPQLLIELLTPHDQQPQKQQQQEQSQQQLDGGNGIGVEAGRLSSSSSSGGGGGSSVLAAGLGGSGSKWGKARAGATTAAAGCAADSWSQEDLKLLCDTADKLCKDNSQQVKVAALAALGQLLPLLPSNLITPNKPPLLSHFVSTAKPPPALAGTRVPASLCAPRLSGHLAALRHRARQQQRQQQRAAEARHKSYNQALQELVQDSDAIVESELQRQGSAEAAAAAATAAAGGGKEAAAAAAPSGSSDGSSSDGSGVLDGGAGVGDSTHLESDSGSAGQQVDDGGDGPWVLRTASDTPVGGDDGDSGADSGGFDAGADAGGGGSSSRSANVGGVDSGVAGTSNSIQQQQQSTVHAVGTAGAELPHVCALYLGKVALHTGPTVWQQHLQGAFVQLSAAALCGGDSDVAASLLLAFPDLAAALGHEEAATILVPVVLELLHTRLDALTPVLSVTLFDIVSALAPELRICLLQMLPNLVLQIDPELAGDWRARLSVAQQLPAVAATVSSSHVAYCLWPLLVSLARDPVFAVRAAAAQQAGPLLLRLPSEELPAEQGDADRAAAAAAALKQQSRELGDDEAADRAAAVAAGDGSSGGGGRDRHGDNVDAAAAAGDSIQQVGPSAEAAEAAEHAIAAAVATRAVPEQQQQDATRGGPGHWMRRGLTSGLSQLQQQVDRVMESPGLQKALNGVDQQLTWLQQHPHSKMLWDIGSKLAHGVRGGGSGSAENASSFPGGGGGDGAQVVTLEGLRSQLTSLQVMEAAELDPCKFLVTPAWHSLAQELLALGSNKDSCNERLTFVVAAGSILQAAAARKGGQQPQQQQQQQQDGTGSGVVGVAATPAQANSSSSGDGELFLQQLLRQLQQLSTDSAAGVRCAVASVAARLLSQGAFAHADMPMERTGSDDMSGGGATSTAASSSCTSPVQAPSDRLLGGSSSTISAGGGGLLTQVLQQQSTADNTPAGGSGAGGGGGGGMSSLASSGILCVQPSTALGVLQDCLQRLQRDPCVSVAEAARFSGSAACGGTALDVGDGDDDGSGSGGDAGVAVAAAAAADAAALASSPPVRPWPAAAGEVPTASVGGEAADLL